MSNIFLSTAARVAYEIVYFPIWWYSRGLSRLANFCLKSLYGAWRAMALAILLKNFFRPMFGQRGWDAYVLSLMTRFCQVISRLILMVLWGLALWIIFLIWIIAPVWAVWCLFVV